MTAYAARWSPSHGMPTLPGFTSWIPPGPSLWKARCVCPKTTLVASTPREQLGVAVGGPGQEALHVGHGRGVAVQRAVDDGRLRKAEQLAHQLLAELLGTELGDRSDRLGSVRAVHEPAVCVTADPGGVRKALEPLDGLLRPRAGGRVVATEDELVRVPRIRQHGIESGQVSVDVVQQRKHRSARYPPEVWAATEPEGFVGRGLDSEEARNVDGEEHGTAREPAAAGPCGTPRRPAHLAEDPPTRQPRGAPRRPGTQHRAAGDAARALTPKGKAPAPAGLCRVGRTGLEPVTSGLSSTGSLLPCAAPGCYLAQ